MEGANRGFRVTKDPEWAEWEDSAVRGFYWDGRRIRAFMPGVDLLHESYKRPIVVVVTNQHTYGNKTIFSRDADIFYKGKLLDEVRVADIARREPGIRELERVASQISNASRMREDIGIRYEKVVPLVTGVLNEMGFAEDHPEFRPRPPSLNKARRKKRQLAEKAARRLHGIKTGPMSGIRPIKSMSMKAKKKNRGERILDRAMKYVK